MSGTLWEQRSRERIDLFCGSIQAKQSLNEYEWLKLEKISKQKSK